ncbi:MAG: aminotransferase class V-fold PLP-dependent enzyme [Bacteroidales bacterium]|nr:aminotransferase class V-fold PLP-dependent enzyme [Bacteroidales bacterium]
MTDINEFKKYAYQFIDWIADYYKNIESYPVKSQSVPGEIYSKLPESPPESGESIEKIFNDFQQLILPGITHWQSPGFHAYFPANTSFPSILAEMLTAALGAQCMKWETSPAAAELEEKMMDWLKNMIGLPSGFSGVIQDSASTATLCAILTAREYISDFSVNTNGITHNKYRVFCSSEAHSSVEKAVKIAGLGKINLVKIDVDDKFSMKPDALEKAIIADNKNGFFPLCVVAALGTTGSTAIDPLKEIGSICRKYNTWLHVDAAYAGSALVLEKYRWMIKGIEMVDSFVFNPHKWMFTNFDCSAYFVKNKDVLVKTFQLVPEYLRTNTQGKKNDYSDWGVQLGRRFRALKLWFVLRNYGVTEIQQTLEKHIKLAKQFAGWISETEHFEILAPVSFNVICFRYLPKQKKSVEEINKFNEDLLFEINKTGKIYLSHTKLNGNYTIRMVTGQTNIEEHHVIRAWEIIKTTAQTLDKN